MACSLETLGTFRLSIDGSNVTPPPTQKARALLVYLAAQKGLELSRERIVELFWPECEPERGRSSLNTALWSIRRSLRVAGVDADDAIDANKSRVIWKQDVNVDAVVFEALAKSGDAANERDAIALYKGEFLQGDYSEWSVALRERIESAYDTLLQRAVERDDDVECARRLVERGSFEEAPYALLAKAEIDAGRAASAAAFFARARERLEEIGSTPSPEFASALSQIRTPGPEAGRRLSMPFCGRAAELRLLVTAFERVAQGRGGLTLVEGAAGAGKSALLSRAMDAANDSSVRLLALACVVDDVRTYGPWSALYERLSSEPFEELVTSGADAAQLADRLRIHLANSVIVVDDAQYLEGDASAVLASLASGINLAGDPIALVIATRPEGARSLSRLLPEHTTIRLRDLREDEIHDALAQVVPRGADAVARAIHARSGGHAFFAAKLLESYFAADTLRIENGAWIVDEAAQTTPPSIRSFIETRLYAKGEHAAAVACALALEHDARADDLIEVCGLGESATLDAIDDLLALGLIEQPASGPEFRFCHDLIREVALRVLNSGRRVRLHRAFVARFENDERLESLVRYARHLRASGQVLNAAKAFEQAARAVLMLNAWRDALQHTRDGIALAERVRPSERVHMLLDDLHAVATRASEEGGQIEAMLAHASEAIAHARGSKDPNRLALAFRRRAINLIDVARLPEARLDVDEAMEIAQKTNDPRALSFALRARATCLILMGEVEDALADGRKSLEIAIENDLDSSLIASAVDQVLISLAILQRFGEAAQQADVALEYARAAHARMEAVVRVRRAQLWYLMDRFEDAERELQLVSSIVDASGTAPASASVYVAPLSVVRYRHRIAAANLALARGRWEDAITLGTETLGGAFGQVRVRTQKGALVVITAYLHRDAPGDFENARAIMNATDPSPIYGLIGMSLCYPVLRAWVAARGGATDAPELVRTAALEAQEAAQKSPLDFDRTFAVLAQAANETGMTDFARELTERADSLRQVRLSRATAPHSKIAN